MCHPRDLLPAAPRTIKEQGDSVKPQPGTIESNMPTASPNPNSNAYDGGAHQLLKWGASMLGMGVLFVVLLEAFLGGFSPTGASTNTGWFALIVALMCIPFGGLLTVLGLAKTLRNRAIARKG